MGNTIETVREVNRAVRNVAVIGLTGVLGTAGYVTYNKYTEDERNLTVAREEVTKLASIVKQREAEIKKQEAEIKEKNEKIQHLEVAMRLLKVDQRLATVDVLSQFPDPETGKTLTKIRFTEVSPDGTPLSDPREFTLTGTTIYIDNWVVKFEDHFIEEADLIRGTSLTLFRRVFGDDENPNQGYVLDQVGSSPGAYARGGQPSEFEQEIWDDFWGFANDPEKAMKKGIRAAHGEAVSIKGEVGKSYKVVLRASDGLSILPEAKKLPST